MSITPLLELGTFESLLEAWQQLPAPALATALELVPIEGLDEVIADTADLGLARLMRIDPKRDPRAAATYVRWLADPPWHATASRPFYTQVFKRLIEIADPRAIGALSQARRSVQNKIKGRTMRTWMVDKLAETVATLRAAHPGGAPTLTEDDEQRVARIKASFAKRPPRPKVSSLTRAATELLAAIRADPSDDGARQVYADVLAERGDPRGEFITMQLARGGKPPTTAQRRRELDLLFQHKRFWLAELTTVVGYLSRYFLRVGPERTGHIRFERGFLAGCNLRGTRSKILAIANHPDLATLENLELREHADVLLARADLPALDELEMSARYLPALLDRPCRARLQTLTLWDDDRGSAFVSAVETAAQLPALRTLRLYPSADLVDGPTAAIIQRGLALPHLETLRVELSEGGAAFQRTAGAWACKVLSRTPRPSAATLRAMASPSGG